MTHPQISFLQLLNVMNIGEETVFKMNVDEIDIFEEWILKNKVSCRLNRSSVSNEIITYKVEKIKGDPIIKCLFV